MTRHDPVFAASQTVNQAERPVVLLVEDDAAVASLIAEILEDVACEILTADSGESALALLERHPVRLAIVDQTLPGMRGQAFIARARASRPDLPAIYISGAPVEAPETASDGAAVQADAVLLKPFRAGQLQATVTALLDRPWH